MKLLTDIQAIETNRKIKEQEKETALAHQRARERAPQQLSELLLERGLYSPITLTFPMPIPRRDWGDLLPQVLNRPCSTCSAVSSTSWRRSQRGLDVYDYTCVSCGESRVEYYLTVRVLREAQVPGPRPDLPEPAFTTAEIQKVGESPAWMAPTPAILRKTLGEVGIDFYRKGASSLRAGRGIGAVAYFRRIVEDHIEDLLRIVEEVSQQQGDVSTLERLQQARSSFQATDRLKLAADQLPGVLRPGGHNPLAVLYGLLSDGLHNLSDEESALLAARAQKALVYFFDAWGSFRERSNEFATEITKLATKTE